VACTKMRLTTKNLALPIRDMFAALFFISVGGLMDVRQVQVFILPAIVLVAVSFTAKFFTVWISAKMLGFGKKISLRSGFGMSSSGGEIALVTAKGGADVGVTSAFLLPLVGTMTIITTFFSPYVIKYGWKLTDRLTKKAST